MDDIGDPEIAINAEIAGLDPVEKHVGGSDQKLFQDLPKAEPYPAELLGPLAEAAAAIEEITEAPMAICAHAVLGVAALAVQAHVDVRLIHGSLSPVSLYLLTIAESGERKSACDKLAMAPVREYERELNDERRRELRTYQNKLSAWQERRRSLLKAIGDMERKEDDLRVESLSKRLEELGEQPEAPLHPSIISDDPTLEGIIKNLHLSRPSLGLFSDEAGMFFGGYAMSKDNRLKTMAGLSKFWSGDPINRWRADDGISYFCGRRFSAHMMVQPVAVEETFRDPVARQQGFLARFLIVEPESKIGSRYRIGEPPDPDSSRKLADFHRTVDALLRISMPLRIGTRNELTPRAIGLDSTAFDLMQSFGCDVERDQGPGRQYKSIRPFASKAMEQAMRLAAVFQVFEDPNSQLICADNAQLACNLMLYYLGEQKRLAEQAPIIEERQAAVDIWDWIVKKWEGGPFISVADVQNEGPNRFRGQNSTLKEVFSLLCTMGKLEPARGPRKIKGKNRRGVFTILESQISEG